MMDYLKEHAMGILIVVVAAAVGIGSAMYFKSDDSFIEETAEDIIEQQMKLPKGSVDLTPGSPENK